MRAPMFDLAMNDTNDLPLPNLHALIARHGTFAVGLAFLRAALAHRPHPPDDWADRLSDHMRRDIGLLPRPDAKTARRGWDR